MINIGGDTYLSMRKRIRESAREVNNQKRKRNMAEKYEDVNWRPWQRIELNAFERDPDPRKDLWIWDQTGDKGKSFLATYLGIYMRHCYQ